MFNYQALPYNILQDIYKMMKDEEKACLLSQIPEFYETFYEGQNHKDVILIISKVGLRNEQQMDLATQFSKTRPAPIILNLPEMFQCTGENTITYQQSIMQLNRVLAEPGFLRRLHKEYGSLDSSEKQIQLISAFEPESKDVFFPAEFLLDATSNISVNDQADNPCNMTTKVFETPMMKSRFKEKFLLRSTTLFEPADSGSNIAVEKKQRITEINSPLQKINIIMQRQYQSTFGAARSRKGHYPETMEYLHTQYHLDSTRTPVKDRITKFQKNVESFTRRNHSGNKVNESITVDSDCRLKTGTMEELGGFNTENLKTQLMLRFHKLSEKKVLISLSIDKFDEEFQNGTSSQKPKGTFAYILTIMDNSDYRYLNSEGEKLDTGLNKYEGMFVDIDDVRALQEKFKPCSKIFDVEVLAGGNLGWEKDNDQRFVQKLNARAVRDVRPRRHVRLRDNLLMGFIREQQAERHQ
ncbi:hypothetical protein WICPIJ_002085 [Wickerhamomyces pijperi]|uniref:Uncharacterized protein n=1 Tax=Wickerhamomyces pijperi TaxID=599730 RepID=A0A9P8QCF9_WICPI|nr:hypothetical protein WICPIJ_002085 [Wickerhamomyces pijperi]